MGLELRPISKIEADLGVQNGGPVQKFFANACYLHMDKYVPMDSGDLAHIASISNDGKYIIYHVPYSIYQYRGVREDGTHQINEANRNRSKHPQATSYWDKKMMSAEQSEILEEVADYIKTHGGK